MRVFGRSSTLGGPTIPYYTICCSELNFFSKIILNAFSLSSPPPITRTITADDPARPGADRGNPPLFSGLLRPPPFQRPDPALKLLVLGLHSLQHFADPLHIPVRLVDELPGGLFFGHPGNLPG